MYFYPMQSKAKYSQLIKEKALSLGFLNCGISKAGFLEEEAPRLEKWLNENRFGEMSYMQNYFDKRLDPTKLVEGSKSVISLLYNYYPHETQKDNTYKVAKYAYGEDYHHIVKKKVWELLHFIQEEIGEVEGRAFVDSAPVLEKAWASKSGLGWQGKNGNLISKKVGSFFFLAELVIDLDLEYDSPTTDHCGSCKKCIEACPTDAIIEPYVVDGSKCISYFTIELKDEIPQGNQFEDWMFGCDICQDVCPWNRFSKPHDEEKFLPHTDLLHYDKKQWEEITEDVFRTIFKKSAVKRTKFKGLERNINYLKNND
ncbi:epoxyqueuosine reductase [Flavobacteriaceae bacterium UJ101]|nr:epoxyqueuosine reductase [Flavobacteriaceae bacterium UJ101]